jgi:PKD repeat protein
MGSKIIFRALIVAFPSFLWLFGAAGVAQEYCDDFPEHHGEWELRLPKCGPTATLLAEGEGFLQFHAPDGFIANGEFNVWDGVHQEPSLRRIDMGSGDWTITTREALVNVPINNRWGAGLAVGFGTEADNEKILWGLYSMDGELMIEHPKWAGSGQLGIYRIETGVPVSVQIQKTGNDYAFRHKTDNDADWIEDQVVTSLVTGGSVSWVGLYLKSWGGTGAPEILANFDFFCLEADGLTDPGPGTTDPVIYESPLANLDCQLAGDGRLDLTWLNPPCNDPVRAITVKIAGEVVSVLPADASGAVLEPPFPGPSIMTVTVENDPTNVLSCKVARPIFEECDEFKVDPLAGGLWQLRKPVEGPTISTEENPESLRFFAPAGVTVNGDFDSWTTADRAPSLERNDMGAGDWTITAREVLVSPPANGYWGVGLAVGFGTHAENERIMWGLYGADGQLVIEHTGSELGRYAIDPGAVSVQIEKTGNDYTFRHRSDDSLDWTVDKVVVSLVTTGRPVTWVGLYLKTFAGTAAPEVTADFEYFCLQIPDSPPKAMIEAVPDAGPAPLEVRFSGESSIDPSGGAMTYRWDFGDGGTAEETAPAHIYAESGIYTVVLKVTDDEENVGTTSTEVAVSDDTTPFTLDQLGAMGKRGYVLLDDAAPGGYCLHAGGILLNLESDNADLLEIALSGDFQVTAKITEADLASGGRAGLMARLSANSNSPNVLMSIDGANDGYQFQHRLTAGATTMFNIKVLDPARGALPAWIGLERRGKTFIGSYSIDGVTFEEYGQKDIPALDVADLLVGLAACSGSETSRAAFCFELSGFGSVPGRPAKPTGVTAAPGNGQVTVDWSDNAEGDLQGYNLYRSIGGGALTKVNAALLTISEHTDTGLANGVEHCYVVRAMNPAGESVPSDGVCATPQGDGVPQFRRGDADGSGKLDLTDAISTLQFLYMGYTAPACKDAADTDDSGKLDLTDAISSLQFQFMGGTPPADPGPANCGPDPTAGDEYKECNYPSC